MAIPAFETMNNSRASGRGSDGIDCRREADAIRVLFGPQGTVTSDSLLEMRDFLRDTPALDFILTTASELPALWAAILDACPSLDRLPAKARLNELVRFLLFEGRGDTLAILGSEPLPTNNLILSLLTVILQIIDFWKLSHGHFFGDENNDNSSNNGNASYHPSNISDVQGFCLGFLTAMSVSCSRSEAQFQALASKAMRLALCLGAWVDLDALNHDVSECALAIAVRWKSDAHRQQLERTMGLHPRVSTINHTATDTHSPHLMQDIIIGLHLVST